MIVLTQVRTNKIMLEWLVKCLKLKNAQKTLHMLRVHFNAPISVKPQGINEGQIGVFIEFLLSTLGQGKENLVTSNVLN